MYARLLVVVALLSAVAPLAAAEAPAKAEDPVVLTKGLLADLICTVMTDNRITFTYDFATDRLVAASTMTAYAMGNPAARTHNEALYQARVDRALALIRRYVSPAVKSSLSVATAPSRR